MGRPLDGHLRVRHDKIDTNGDIATVSEGRHATYVHGSRARGDPRPWPAVPRPWTSAWWELRTTRTRTSSSWTEWMTRCWPRRADRWSSDRCPCAVTEDGDSWPGRGATDGRTLLSPRWSRSCGRGAEHLADP